MIECYDEYTKSYIEWIIGSVLIAGPFIIIAVAGSVVWLLDMIMKLTKRGQK